LYQTLVGSYPDNGHADRDYQMRLFAYLEKAVREAKVHSSWTNPDEAYEQALRHFAASLLASPPFLDDLWTLVQRVTLAARLSSLAQVAIKIASPGVPDIYQGGEFWDLSLVDPDNRRPVDFAARRRTLAELMRRFVAGPASRAELASEVSVAAALADGRAKLLLTAAALRFRRAHGPLFLEGAYLPLDVDGAHAIHVIAFARQHDGEQLVCVAPRLLVQLCAKGLPIRWNGRVRVPAAWNGTWNDIVSGTPVEARDGTLALADCFAAFPVALLSRHEAENGQAVG
jgi:(1->4)-alpha-D-glucan 1-alpha-D-glucosylmutase